MSKGYEAIRNHHYESGIFGFGAKRKPLDFSRGFLIKVGDDLLSHNCSTIGAGGLNFSVRNGKRWNPAAIVT